MNLTFYLFTITPPSQLGIPIHKPKVNLNCVTAGCNGPLDLIPGKLQVLDHHLLSGNGLPTHPAGREASLVEYPVNLKHPSYSSGFLKFSSWTCPATLFLSLTPLSSPIQLVMWMRHSMVVLCILNAEPMDHQGDALAHIEPGPGALQSLPQQHHKPQHNQVPIEC